MDNGIKKEEKVVGSAERANSDSTLKYDPVLAQQLAAQRACAQSFDYGAVGPIASAPKPTRDAELVSIEDLQKRVEMLRKNGVRIYEDGTLKIAIDIQAGPSANAPDTEYDLVNRLRALRGGRNGL